MSAVETHNCCDCLRLIGDELPALVCERQVDVSEGFETAIGDGLVDERPEAFSRLQFGGVGRQEDQTDALGDRELCLAMPAGVVGGENDVAVSACADGLGEVGQQLFKERLADAVRQIPDRLSVRRLNEGCDVGPFIPMMAERQRPLADRRPDAAADRLQAEAMIVGRPDFDGLVRVLLRFFGGGLGEFYPAGG